MNLDEVVKATQQTMYVILVGLKNLTIDDLDFYKRCYIYRTIQKGKPISEHRFNGEPFESMVFWHMETGSLIKLDTITIFEDRVCERWKVNNITYPYDPKPKIKRLLFERVAIPKDIRTYLLNIYNNRCAKCSSKHRLEVDHIIPITRGGGNNLENLQILCKTCNVRKSNKLVY